tara:strand:- start:7618 stop:8724 length:1107 start_codon:yes stop_codon:yes gene_type:complete
LKVIKDSVNNLYKYFIYRIFFIFYGKIKGIIVSGSDKRIKVEKITKEKKINYKVFKVKDGRLYTDRIHDTAIILDNSIIEGPSHQLRPINNAEVEKNIVFTKGTPRIKKKLQGRVLSLLTGGGGNENYSHWLLDVLPRIALCEDVLNISEVDFFLLPSMKKKFQRETLDLLNIEESKRISSENFRHISASEIVVTDHPYCISGDATNDIHNIPEWISSWLKKKYLNIKNKGSNYPKKIFIDRSDAKSNTSHLRKIINENDVRDYLLQNGFKTIILGKYHFQEQVQIFNNADVIVGLHGAGLTNVCFSKPGAKLIEFKSMTTGFQYENLAKKNKLVYNCISCKSSKFDQNNQYGHIKVPINKLEEFVKT